MSLRELFNSITPAQTEKFRGAFCAVRAGDKDAWKAIVYNMTDPEWDLLIDICDEMIEEKRRKVAQHED